MGSGQHDSRIRVFPLVKLVAPIGFKQPAVIKHLLKLLFLLHHFDKALIDLILLINGLKHLEEHPPLLFFRRLQKAVHGSVQLPDFLHHFLVRLRLQKISLPYGV